MVKQKKANTFKNKKYIIGAILIALLILLSSIGFWVYKYYKESYDNSGKIGKVNMVDKNINFTEAKGITNVLLLSSDARPGETESRSDSIMILTIDNINKKLKVTSLMRDMLVEINGHGEEKLNHAFAYGGPSKTIETIQNNFGIKIDNYIIVDFNAFRHVIDSIDGVEVDIKDYELKELNKYILDGGGSQKDLLPNPGVYNLNGYQALSYARIRKVGNGEFERTERQRELLQIIANKMQNISTVKFVSLLNELFPYVKTNMGIGTAIDYALTAMKIANSNTFEIEQFRVPLDSISKGGIVSNEKGWVFVIDKAETAKALQEFIFNNNKSYVPDTSNFNNIVEKYFKDYNITDDKTHPDYEPNYSRNSYKSDKNNLDKVNSTNKSTNNKKNTNNISKPNNNKPNINSNNNTSKPTEDNNISKPNDTVKPDKPIVPEVPTPQPDSKPESGSNTNETPQVHPNPDNPGENHKN
ncbi:LCP family protein [Clostridium tarantellae]|uniref:Regulatory protein MsrR n=1 Tax=Clostridium tarantellae TaxID=39493 RepID=A0A6I1MPU6_9CLOT|nr:LCP family protein [Clostridium tarantellae]MPQ44242.1 LytR family transcriptional regulator [Clostridium tarantellae]